MPTSVLLYFLIKLNSHVLNNNQLVECKRFKIYFLISLSMVNLIIKGIRHIPSMYWSYCILMRLWEMEDSVWRKLQKLKKIIGKTGIYTKKLKRCFFEPIFWIIRNNEVLTAKISHVIFQEKSNRKVSRNKLGKHSYDVELMCDTVEKKRS